LHLSFGARCGLAPPDAVLLEHVTDLAEIA